MGKISESIYRLLPENTFRFLSAKYYHLQKIVFPAFSEEDIRSLLTKKLDIKKGSVVFIHSSLDKLNLTIPPFRLLQVLLETVGEEGTLLFPAWHYLGRAEDNLKAGKPFDAKRSPTVLGLLPELARRHPRAYRSLHPTASITAIGKHAEELTSTHHRDVYPCGSQSPMHKMLKYKARIIGLGEKVVSLSFVHTVEDTMKTDFPVKTLSEETITAQVRDFHKEIHNVETYVPARRIQNRNIEAYFAKHIPKAICHRFKNHGVNFFTCDAPALYDRMKELAEVGITIYESEKTA